jgi:L-ascorbate metabolism protein UlaG (beta-lactamase superfamily)
LKKIILIIVLVVIAGLPVAVYYLTSPSGNIDNYKAYYTNDAGEAGNGSVKVTFLGVSTLLVDDGETQLLIDGFFTRPSLWRTLLAKVSTDTIAADRAISRYRMESVQGIFVAHSHYDHALDIAYVTRRTRAQLYGSASTLNIARGGGLGEDRMTLYQPGKEIQLGKFTVTVLRSRHSPSALVNRENGKTIDNPLHQPATVLRYIEGGSFDFVIRHESHTLYIKPSANYVEGMLDTVRADVLFLGLAPLGTQDLAFMDRFYDQTIGQLKPKLVIPLHWDNFSLPLSGHLTMLPKIADRTAKTFDFMIARTKSDSITFKILQGGGSINLFSK